MASETNVNGITPEMLQKSARLAFRRFKPARKVRRDILREYCGPRYQNLEGEMSARPLMLINSSIGILTPNLASGEVKTRVTSDHFFLAPAADLLGLAIQQVYNKLNYTHTVLRRVVLDALMGAGITKTAMMPADLPRGLLGNNILPGMPYSKRVDLDDYVVDPNATSREDALWEGDRYRVPIRFVKESGLYDADAFDELQYTCDADDENERVRNLSTNRSDVREANELVDYVDLIDIFLPADQIVVTVPYGLNNTKFLRVIDWAGPEEGPYDMLTLMDVPDNIVPVAPASVWLDLHFAINELMNKQIRMARRMKTLLGYRGDATDDAQNVVDGGDGESVRMDNPEGLREYNFGGPDQGLAQQIAVMNMMFNDVAGNPRLVGGLGAEAKTLGQEQMLQGNATVRLDDMAELVKQFMGRGASKIGWFLHHNPSINLPLYREFPNGMGIGTVYSPETREGNFLDYNFKFEVYQQKQLDPMTRAGRIMQFATEVVPTAFELAQNTQGMFPVVQFLKKIARELGIADLDMSMMDPQAVQQAMQQIAMTNPQAKGEPGGQAEISRVGHTTFAGKGKKNPNAPQLAGGARDSGTVTNGKFSSRPQTGASQPRY